MEDIGTYRKTVNGREAAWIEFARIVQTAASRKKARRPLKPRRGAEDGAPVIARYVFENATVCLEIPGGNR
jgi:hypothetical protein